ncbi:hypothetical protein Tco_0998169 [Tanacetum coccineum]
MEDSKVHCQKEVRRQIDEDSNETKASTTTTSTVRQRRPDLPYGIIDVLGQSRKTTHYRVHECHGSTPVMILYPCDQSPKCKDEPSIAGVDVCRPSYEISKDTHFEDPSGKSGFVTKPSSVLKAPIVAASPLQMDNVKVLIVSSSDQCVVDNVPANDPCTCDISSSGHIRATSNY